LTEVVMSFDQSFPHAVGAVLDSTALL